MRLVPCRECAVLGGLILALIASGCSRDVYKTAIVKGTVLCDGKPATGGTVVLRPIEAPEKTGRPKGQPGLSSTGVVGTDGKFSMVIEPRGYDRAKTGALIGPHEVLFRLPRTEAWEVEPSDLTLPPAELAKLKDELAKRPIYQPLTCGRGISPDNVEVKPGTNEFQFVLQPKPAVTAKGQDVQAGRRRNYNAETHIKFNPAKE